MYCQLQPSTLHTEEIGFGLLPTPTTQENPHYDVELTETGRRKAQNGNSHSMNLTDKAIRGLLPTPTASDVEGGVSNPKQISMKNGRFIRTSNNTGTQFGAKLRDAVGLLPTPSAFDWNTAQTQEKYQERKEMQKDKGINLHYPLKQMAMDINLTGKTSQLSAQFVMEMMGFPTDWTELPFLNGETNQSKPEATQ
jgi:hypothetical protein